MIQISSKAQQYFRDLLTRQNADWLGIRLSAVNGGTPSADARLEFCEQADLAGDEWAVDCDGFTLYVAGDSVPFFDSAEIDLVEAAGGSQVNIRAPKIKGGVPGADASLVERVRFVLESEINPQLASHGGRVAVEQVSADGEVVLRFGGGCHGCSQVGATLKHGVEKTLMARVPEISAVRDATDHASGSNPYFREAG